MMRSFLLYISAAVAAALLLLSCTNEPYDVGNGDYSYTRAYISMLVTKAGGHVVSFYTDGGTNYTLEHPQKLFTNADDTLYRALVYYNTTDNVKATIIGMDLVLVSEPFRITKDVAMKTDPVDLISSWKSADGQYINFALGLKTGQNTDKDTSSHIIGFGISQVNAIDGTSSHEYVITLYHDQNNVPASYTTTAYMSFPIGKSLSKGDRLTFNIVTFSGTVTKTFHL